MNIKEILIKKLLLYGDLTIEFGDLTIEFWCFKVGLFCGWNLG